MTGRPKTGGKVGILVGILVGIKVGMATGAGEFLFFGVPKMAPPFAFLPFLLTPVFVAHAESLSTDFPFLSIVPYVVLLPLGHAPPLPLAVSINFLSTVSVLSYKLSASPVFESGPL